MRKNLTTNKASFLKRKVCHVCGVCVCVHTHIYICGECKCKVVFEKNGKMLIFYLLRYLPLLPSKSHFFCSNTSIIPLIHSIIHHNPTMITWRAPIATSSLRRTLPPSGKVWCYPIGRTR